MKMTVKEIAELAGCSNSTVNSRVKEIFPDKSGGRGRKTLLSEESAYVVISSITGDNYMTANDIAAAAGCHLKTVYRVANDLYPDERNGKGATSKYDEDQCHKIMERLPKKNNVNETQERTNEVSRVSSPDSSAMGTIVAAIDKMQDRQETFMLKIVEMLKPGATQPAQIEIEIPAQIKAPDMSSRSRLTKVLRSHCQCNRIPYQDAWNQLYASHMYRTGMNFKLRAKNRGLNTLDLFEIEDEIRVLLSIAIEMWGE